MQASRQTGIESRSACFSDIPCESLLIFFFQKPLEQRGIIACAVGNVVHINRFSDQPVHADILSGNHIAVSAVSQFLVLRDMAGQRKQLQLGGFQNHKVSHADRLLPTVFWIPPMCRQVRRRVGMPPLPPALRAASRFPHTVRLFHAPDQRPCCSRYTVQSKI